MERESERGDESPHSRGKESESGDESPHSREASPDAAGHSE
jgi:hypothetical protein